MSNFSDFPSALLADPPRLDEIMSARRSDETRDQHKTRLRRLRRLAWLDLLVPDRKCRNCKTVLKDTLWCLKKQGEFMFACCRRCLRNTTSFGDEDSLKKLKDQGIKSIYSKLFDKEYLIGDMMLKLRTWLGMSRADFGKLCGWSSAYQWKIERSGTRTHCFEEKRAKVREAVVQAMFRNDSDEDAWNEEDGYFW